jgi:DNA-binding response OmpR family regulator
MSNGRILIVENRASDSDDFQTTLTTDFDCKVVTTFRAAGEALRQTHYDIVLLDLHLDDMEPVNTVTRLPELLRSSVNPNVRVIIVTVYLIPEPAWEAARNRQVYDYLIKPVSGEDLNQTVRAALSPDKRRALELNRYEAITARIDTVVHAIPNHSKSVTQLSVSLLRELGADEQEIERCRLLAPLHDISKIGMWHVWEELLETPDIHTPNDVNAYLEGLKEDEQKRLTLLIPKLFRFEAEWGHCYESFLATKADEGLRAESDRLAATIALADAYEVFAFCRRKEEFSYDDAIDTLSLLGFSQQMVEALENHLKAKPNESRARSEAQKDG